MKRAQKKFNSKKITLLAILIVIIALGGAASAYYIYTSTSNKSATTSSEGASDASTGNPADSNDSNADSDGKQNFLDNESKNNSSPPPEFTSDKISISIKETSTSVTVATKLLGFSGEGTCQLKVTKDAQTISASADVIYQAEYSTCAGFSLDKAKLGSGTWKVELSVSDKGTAYSQTSEFTIKP